MQQNQELQRSIKSIITINDEYEHQDYALLIVFASLMNQWLSVFLLCLIATIFNRVTA